MRSQNYPLPVPNPQPNSMDLGIALETDDNSTEVLDTILEDYGERPTIELCEVQLRFDGVNMSTIHLSDLYSRKLKLL